MKKLLINDIGQSKLSLNNAKRGDRVKKGFILFFDKYLA